MNNVDEIKSIIGEVSKYDAEYSGKQMTPKQAVELILAHIQKEKKEAVRGLMIRQISGFTRDGLGQWWKRYPEGRVLVTDELLLDTLNVRQENIDAVVAYLLQTKGADVLDEKHNVLWKGVTKGKK
jgi:hypothetical protein